MFAREAECQPIISFRSLKRARTTIEDFALTYFPYHGLKIPEDFFKHLDILVFVEATIYAVDEANESLAKLRLNPQHAHTEALKTLQAVLEGQQLWTAAIAAELNEGVEYWRAERDICRRLSKCACSTAGQGKPCVSADEIHAASQSKSFDYRVLNLLLYKLSGEEPDAGLLDFLRADEHLVDIGDDLVDYEEDVLENSFNVYRGYVHVYGRDAPEKLMQRIVSLEEEHARLLGMLPPHQRSHFRRRHTSASSAQGSGNWTIPGPILSEQQYRVEASSAG
ncbi:g3261 [Coccomyxa viridis]|uniref:G3261 protein n=1 Tax=Coccomyxa viridis TaxID=1274662 RepID=A0ABP1FMD3_9CHLO